MKKLPALLSAVACAIAFFFSGCATKPEDIAPAYVSSISYERFTLEQLREEELRLQAALATASDAQRKARSNDTLGVIFIGLPVSSLSGSNQASNIARLKGELEAVQKALVQKAYERNTQPKHTEKPNENNTPTETTMGEAK